jgi:hypothetical protein
LVLEVTIAEDFVFGSRTLAGPAACVVGFLDLRVISRLNRARQLSPTASLTPPDLSHGL